MAWYLHQDVRDVIEGNKRLTPDALNHLMGGNDPVAYPQSILAKFLPSTGLRHRGLTADDLRQDLTFNSPLRLGPDSNSPYEVYEERVRGIPTGKLDVRAFGAKADGATNDSTGITNALEHTILTSGAPKSIWFPTWKDGLQVGSPIRNQYVWEPTIPWAWWEPIPNVQWEAAPGVVIKRSGDYHDDYLIKTSEAVIGGSPINYIGQIVHFKGFTFKVNTYPGVMDFRNVGGGPPGMVLIEDCVFKFANNQAADSLPVITTSAKLTILKNCWFHNCAEVLDLIDGDLFMQNCIITYSRHFTTPDNPHTIININNGNTNHASLRDVYIATDPTLPRFPNAKPLVIGGRGTLVTRSVIDTIGGSGSKLIDLSRSLNPHNWNMHNIISDNTIINRAENETTNILAAIDGAAETVGRNIFQANSIGASSRHRVRFQHGIRTYESGSPPVDALGSNVLFGNVAGVNVSGVGTTQGLTVNGPANPLDLPDQDIIRSGRPLSCVARTSLKAITAASTDIDEIPVEWNRMGAGFNLKVHTLHKHEGELWAGGEFTQSGRHLGEWDQVEELPAGQSVVRGTSHIAFWNGGEWEPIATEITGDVKSFEGVNNDVTSFVTAEGRLFVFGLFSGKGDESAWERYDMQSMAEILPDHTIVSISPGTARFGLTGTALFSNSSRIFVAAPARHGGQFILLGGDFVEANHGGAVNIPALRVARMRLPFTDTLGNDHDARILGMVTEPADNDKGPQDGTVYTIYQGGSHRIEGGTAHRWYVGGDFTSVKGVFYGNLNETTEDCAGVVVFDQSTKRFSFLGRHLTDEPADGELVGVYREDDDTPGTVYAINGHADLVLIGGDFDHYKVKTDFATWKSAGNLLALHPEYQNPLGTGRPSVKPFSLPSPVRTIERLPTTDPESLQGVKWLIATEGPLYVLSFIDGDPTKPRFQSIQPPGRAYAEPGQLESVDESASIRDIIILGEGEDAELVVGGAFYEGAHRLDRDAYGEKMNVFAPRKMPTINITEDILEETP